MSATRDAILQAQDLPLTAVEVPEWNTTVHIRPLTGAERDQFEASLFVGKGDARREDLTNLRARLVVLCACDETGARLFSAADVDALGAKNAAALERLYAASRRASGLDSRDVEDARKN